MAIHPLTRDVFSYFQNLNLLGLMHDLRSRRVARGAWSRGGWLCPVAHGLPGGQHVRHLAVMGQVTDLSHGCEYAARYLGANPLRLHRFVRCWDDQPDAAGALINQLEELWEERQADADLMQELLAETECIPIT